MQPLSGKYTAARRIECFSSDNVMVDVVHVSLFIMNFNANPAYRKNSSDKLSVRNLQLFYYLIIHRYSHWNRNMTRLNGTF